MVQRIIEDSIYDQDLQQGRKRKFVQDTKVLIEIGRRLGEDNTDWYEIAALSLPPQTVSRLTPLEIDPTEEGP